MSILDWLFPWRARYLLAGYRAQVQSLERMLTGSKEELNVFRLSLNDQGRIDSDRLSEITRRAVELQNEKAKLEGQLAVREAAVSEMQIALKETVSAKVRALELDAVLRERDASIIRLREANLQLSKQLVELERSLQSQSSVAENTQQLRAQNAALVAWIKTTHRLDNVTQGPIKKLLASRK